MLLTQLTRKRRNKLYLLLEIHFVALDYDWYVFAQ